MKKPTYSEKKNKKGRATLISTTLDSIRLETMFFVTKWGCYGVYVTFSIKPVSPQFLYYLVY